MATSSADEAIKARMEAAAHHDGAFSIDDSDVEDAHAPPAAAASAPAGAGLRGSVHDLVRKLEAGK